ncbi:MAG: 4-(cytidine 5'-diphospho)-2-C-methyl-D-erythritol kinase [Clostridia bacterium]|nr:4-(cytidine 5'-diphospho)-2-C-methyl-D-erythritol kinase [Clostridia bacterium]
MRTERANAKINLYLDVVGRRENGYHNIISIMQTVSVCDLVSVEFRPGLHTRISLSASGNDRMPTDCRNLAWRAAELYLAKIGQSGEVSISIEKHIPMAAGLAGGSSDAAAVLRAMNHLCGNRLSVEELCSLGAGLGADIPFCIIGGAALVSGIGEELKPIAEMPFCHTVVACMGEGISTPWGYGKLDELHGNFAQSKAKDARCDRLIDAMKKDGILDAADCFYNIFEEVVPSVQPYVNRLKTTMLEKGAKVSMMSGSGPSVFGLFESQEAAVDAVETLKSMGAAAFLCHPAKAYKI